ncbi:MAG: TonB-dependent receptor [Mariprofundaceae bacterium]
MNKQIKLTIVVMLSIPLVAHAQDDLGTIDVTAFRVEAPSITSSRPVIIIDRQTIEKSHVENVVDLLKGQANIVVSDTTGVGAKSRVDLGGYGETAAANSVVLIDGRRINNPDLSGIDWSQIPLDQIERIEIIHGGGSVLYGDGAVGGVINIITRIPESGGKITLNGGSFGTFEGSGRVGADAGKTRVELNVSGISTDGYRDNSFFERFDGGARAEIDILSNLQVYLRGNHHRDRVGFPGALTAAEVAVNRKQTSRPDSSGKTTDSFFDGGLNWMSEAGFEADVAASIRRRENNSIFSAGTFDSVLLTNSIRPNIKYSGQKALRWMAVAGADIGRTNGNTKSVFFATSTASFSERKRDGYYGLLEIGSNDYRWNISGGMRSEKVTDDFQQKPNFSSSQRKTTWEAGTSLGIMEQLRLRLNASSSVRFPLLDELTFPGASPLRVQTGTHYSVALRQDWNSAWIEASWSRVGLDYEIFFNPIGGAFGFGANENYTDQTRHDVVMLSGLWKAHEWATLSANYTYTDAIFRGGAFSGKDIPAIATNRVGASWLAEWGRGFTTTLNLTYVGESFLISDQVNVRAKLPSYLVLDAVASYRWNDMEAFVRIDNLTNEKYSSYGAFGAGIFGSGNDSFYPSPEIGVRAGVSYTF